MSVTRREFFNKSAVVLGSSLLLEPLHHSLAKEFSSIPLAKGLQMSHIKEAVLEFRHLLGNENVLIDIQKLVPYTKIMIPSPDIQHQPIGALMVHSVRDIQGVLKICNQYRIPIWPISTGRNIGYGSAAPATPGQLVLDMRNMNKILEIDSDLCTALVEPGVTYRQLIDTINIQNLNIWVSVPSSGGLSGPMGNILDRGVGYNRAGEHFANFSGMEVILADGEILRTGLGGIANSTAWQSYRWGFGPWVDGLFSQSNFGVVTKIGVWMMQKPEAYQTFVIGWDDLEKMTKGIDVARKLRMDNVIENGVVGNTLYSTAQLIKRSALYKGKDAIPEAILAEYFSNKKMPRWGFVSCLYGTKEQIEVNLKIVQKAFKAEGGNFITGKDLTGDSNASHMERVMTGRTDMNEFGLYNFRGGGG